MTNKKVVHEDKREYSPSYTNDRSKTPAGEIGKKRHPFILNELQLSVMVESAKAEDERLKD
jgi:hypothetical protein